MLLKIACTKIRLSLMVNMVIYLFELFIAAALLSIRYISTVHKK